MYLSTVNSLLLDKIIKTFEVAYRSHIVDALKQKYPSKQIFQTAVNDLNDSFEKSSLILSHKYKIRIKAIKSNLKLHYDTIELCYASYLNKDHNNDVPYVSEIIDYVYFFFNDCFQQLANGFSTIEEFKDYSSKYHLVRNALSHPASSKITVQHAKEVIIFIRRLVNNISLDKFWFVSQKNIVKEIEDLSNSIDNAPLKYHNLNEISFSHNKLIAREKNLKH